MCTYIYIYIYIYTCIGPLVDGGAARPAGGGGGESSGASVAACRRRALSCNHVCMRSLYVGYIYIYIYIYTHTYVYTYVYIYIYIYIERERDRRIAYMHTCVCRQVLSGCAQWGLGQRRCSGEAHVTQPRLRRQPRRLLSVLESESEVQRDRDRERDRNRRAPLGP